MKNIQRSNLSISQRLPRGIYKVMVGLAAWLIISVWGFVGTGYTALVLTVVSLFIAVAVGLSLILAGIARRRRSAADQPEPDTLRAWLSGQFEAHTGNLQAAAAAIEVLLPLAAVAFGMTFFALVHHFDVGA